MAVNDAHPGLWAAGIAAWFMASLLHRSITGKGVFARPRPDALFVERWASGRAGTGLLARLSTARHCLQVQVTPQALQVTPQFPFILGFMAELYGLDQNVPLAQVRRVEHLGGRFAQAIEVAIVRPDGSPDVLQLLLRQGDAFVARLEAARAGAPA